MHKQRCRIYLVLALLAFCFLSLCPVVKTPAKAEAEVNSRVHYIDVGQGDSTFVELPDGKTLLIDAGEENMGKRVVKYIKNLGYTKIDYLIATHSDADHVGGMDRVFKEFEVATIYRPFTISVYSGIKGFQDELYSTFNENLQNYPSEAGEEYAEFLSIAYQETVDGNLSQIKVISSQEEIVSSDVNKPYFINFYWPTAVEYFSTNRITMGYTSLKQESNNDTSAVVEIMTTDSKFMWMGDLTEVGENTLLSSLSASDQIKFANVSVLKVGHHGSSSSTSQELLAVANPKFAIISVGEDNSYGHPSTITLERLEKNGINVYRTDFLGTIIVEEKAGILYFSNIKTQTVFEKYAWAFYTVIAVVVVGIIAICVIYPMVNKHKMRKQNSQKPVDKIKNS